MLEAIGADNVDDLFTAVPADLRERATIDLPDGLGEAETQAAMEALAALNTPVASFQGAGAYHHFVPAAVTHIMQRSEFATAYTPYQPEVSQGTLQACFEFQTYVARLTGLDVANASLYDGASAFAEALLMALRIHRKRERLLVSKAIHPEYLAVARTYLEGYGRGEIVEIDVGEDGRTDLDRLERELDADTAAVCIGYPNFFGVIEDLSSAARIAKREEALTVAVTAESLALALLRSPGSLGADIAVAEGQSFGLPPAYGGPGVGLFATRTPYVRQMPGRLVGETLDAEGRRGYVLTLATREQHIRRDKATSNICTNQGLAALVATVYLSLAGRTGLRRLAERNLRAAHAAADRLVAESGAERLFRSPFFNEFALRVADCERWFDAAVADGLVPGVRLGPLFPGDERFADAVLVTVTELTADAAVDRLVASVAARAAA